MKYGLLCYKTVNIGDEIQGLAAKRFLPRVDVLLERDSLSKVESDEEIKLIMNGWFTRKPKNWPPSPVIKPLFISLHISERCVKELTSPKSIEYFKKHEPIGCRDYYTLNLLGEKGVNAYFSGCLTLTLKNNNLKNSNELLIVDLGKEAIKYIPKRISKRASFIDHYSYPPPMKIIHTFLRNSPKIISNFMRITRVNFLSLWLRSSSNKFKEAEKLLNRYSKAKLVITSRLHCALPCIALGTPVIFVPKNPNDVRFKGYESFLKIHSLDELKHIDWPNVPISTVPASLINSLEKKCRDFIKE